MPKVIKIAGLSLLAVIVIVILFRLVGSSIVAMMPNNLRNTTSIMPIQSGTSYDAAKGYGESASYAAPGTASLSIRNVVSTPGTPIYQNGGTTGSTAEQFEVTEYNATIETRQLDSTCAKVADLKPLDYVIFENANKFDNGCNYVFKVKKDKAEEILAIIKQLNPKYLYQNTNTIKQVVDDYTSEIDILKNQLASIDDTLKNATAAYDDIMKLANQVKDVESLAKIIDSKINTIQQLTQQRINISNQLASLQRSKADQLDRLDYVNFRVSITENKFVDGKVLKDSWVAAIQKFVRDVNQIAQDISVGLVALILIILQYALYIIILLLVVKFGWKLVKRIWKGKN
ncbi:MAG: hypothetical protein PHE24_03510 [Patescibacteria group bacterium]|nr:hypothetical protein [Patescibacteria group bacterium]